LGSVRLKKKKTFIPQRCIKLIKIDIKDIYDVIDHFTRCKQY